MRLKKSVFLRTLKYCYRCRSSLRYRLLLGIVVVRLLRDGIDVLGAVRNHTAVIGETVHDRVVGDSVIKAVLRSLRGYQLQGYHGDHQ